MSLWQFVALVSYLVGVVFQWLYDLEKYQEFDEYTNFPIVWAAKVVITVGCFIEALVWPCSLILDDALAFGKHSPLN